MVSARNQARLVDRDDVHHSIVGSFGRLDLSLRSDCASISHRRFVTMVTVSDEYLRIAHQTVQHFQRSRIFQTAKDATSTLQPS